MSHYSLLTHMALSILPSVNLESSRNWQRLLQAKLLHCSSPCCNGCGLFSLVRLWQLLCVSKYILLTFFLNVDTLLIGP